MTTPWYLQPVEMSIGLGAALAAMWIGKGMGVDGMVVGTIVGGIVTGTFALMQGRGGSRSTDPTVPPALVVPAPEPDEEEEEKT